MTEPEGLRARAALLFRQLREEGTSEPSTGSELPLDERVPPQSPTGADDRPDLPADGSEATHREATDVSTESAARDRPSRATSEPTIEPGAERAEREADGAGPPPPDSGAEHDSGPGPTAPTSNTWVDPPPFEPVAPTPSANLAINVEAPFPTPVRALSSVAQDTRVESADTVTSLEDDRPDRAGAHPGSARPLPRIMAIANQKGGVGKTTTAVNLSAALAELGYRVLVIDLDPQGNATTGLGINARNLDASVYDVILHDVPIEDCIEATTLKNLFVVPATIDLAGAEIELVPVFSRELRLRRAIEAIEGDFDFVLIDCPPSLGLLTVNGLAAAGEVVVPIQCEYYALEGLGQLLRNVNLVKSNLNARLDISTIILTMYDARTRLAEQVVEEVRSHFGDRVCRNVVPRTVRLSEAPSFGQPIIVFDPSSRGAIAYRELAKEVSGGAPQRVR